MIIYTSLSSDDLQTIAAEIGVSLQLGGDRRHISRGRSAGKTRYAAVRILPDRATADAEGNCRHQRESAGFLSDGRKVHAVCWHGHADFMTLIYAADETARIETAFTTYTDRADFLARYRETAARNIGAPIAPIAAASACRCGFRDMSIHAKEGVIQSGDE